MPTLLHGPGCNLGMVGVPLVVHYWVDLQSVLGFRCYDNIRERETSVSACTRCMSGYSMSRPGGVRKKQQQRRTASAFTGWDVGGRKPPSLV